MSLFFFLRSRICKNNFFGCDRVRIEIYTYKRVCKVTDRARATPYSFGHTLLKMALQTNQREREKERSKQQRNARTEKKIRKFAKVTRSNSKTQQQQQYNWVIDWVVEVSLARFVCDMHKNICVVCAIATGRTERRTHGKKKPKREKWATGRRMWKQNRLGQWSI